MADSGAGDDRTRSALIAFLSTIARPGRSPDTVNDGDNLIDVGIIDSLAMLHIIMYLEREHAISLTQSGIDPGELVSISGILDCIARSS